MTAEHERLQAHHDRKANWRHWGPYLSERAWGTVREDYSADGDAWSYFPHDHARSRTYRWNEDGLAGISDRYQYLCFALALWNGQDPILKERLFGLNGHEGNHGEDVKEAYFYIDNTPTHSYMKMLYKYPHTAYPYDELIRENRQRGLDQPEYEITDTGAFDQNRYFDCFVEYAKAGQDDIVIRLTIVNRGDKAAPLTILPTLWFRNTWSWGYEAGPMMDVEYKPRLSWVDRRDGTHAIRAEHPAADTYTLYAEGADDCLFTENETNVERLYDGKNGSPYVKDAFHRFIVNDEQDAVNPDHEGTKSAMVYRREVAAGESVTLRLRLARHDHDAPFADFDEVFTTRQAEADEFYASVQPKEVRDEPRRVQRQAFAGMLWNKQFYYYDIRQWLAGDPAFPPPPENRAGGRNADWRHLTNFDILSMPDNWEYPWFAAWDMAFHTLPFALIDPDYAKRQLILMTREWYMHPNGQFPAYEWAFSDVNPPVHAWAAWRVYRLDAERTGTPDVDFLKSIYLKLLLNFTWWVNQKDEDGHNIFQGGFLGMDNISLFDRSAKLPKGGHIDQSDGTAWMAFYSLTMMKMALEIARHDTTYEDVASKFYEHFLAIARAMSDSGERGVTLWDEEDGFFYDVLHVPDHQIERLKVRSLVGLMPLLAVETLEPVVFKVNADFQRRMAWFTDHRPELSGNMAAVDVPGKGQRILTSIITEERLRRVLGYMLDEKEFLSPYGIRSVSKVHEAHPVSMQMNGDTFTVRYEPAESRSGLFGGNSNWRGPIWFPINYLLIEALNQYYQYYGDDFTVECPTGSGSHMTLAEVAHELSHRLTLIFLRDEDDHCPASRGQGQFRHDEHWRDYRWFHEYFNGDTGEGCGAINQTGWTGLVANLIQQHPKEGEERQGKEGTEGNDRDGS